MTLSQAWLNGNRMNRTPGSWSKDRWNIHSACLQCPLQWKNKDKQVPFGFRGTSAELQAILKFGTQTKLFIKNFTDPSRLSTEHEA